MDLFRFTNPVNQARMERGVLIEDVTSKMWVERFREAGEFTVIAPVDTGIRTKLPIGSFVSHVDSDEIMVVESHEINDDGEDVPEVKITGRGLESFFEQRPVGYNRDFSSDEPVSAYTVPSNPTWTQAVYLIRGHLDSSVLIDPNNALPYFETVSTASGAGTTERQTFPRDTLYKVLMDLLAIDDLGIKVLRPGRTGGHASAEENSVFLIHKGRDRSDSVLFSYDTGDIDTADYLWSNKGLKNAAYIHGKWVDTVVYLGSSSGFKRRWMTIDMSDLDQQAPDAPDPEAHVLIEAAMQIRGLAILRSQLFIALSKAEVSQEAQTSRYRQDYETGDLVTVTGNFNEETIMRVTEHVEIDDNEGSRSYPTLTALTEETA